MNSFVKIVTLASLLFCISPAMAGGQKSGGANDGELKWTSLEEAIARAGKNQTPILLDIYTDWCGWCKKLDKETFNDPDVAEVLGEMFALARVNGESKEEITYKDKKTDGIGLARGFGVKGYPAIIFLDEKGDILTLIPGFLDADRFLPIARYIGTREYEKMEWEAYLKKYEGSKKGGSGSK